MSAFHLLMPLALAQDSGNFGRSWVVVAVDSHCVRIEEGIAWVVAFHNLAYSDQSLRCSNYRLRHG